ncbi:Adaptive-response sensory-kinase SasA [anaerobic digester metagenome]
MQRKAYEVEYGLVGSEMVMRDRADTGPGVPDADKGSIFHRYEKKQRGVGEGLGLYLAQILVERYGGRIWAADRVPGRPECGAAFQFTLKKA